MGGGGQRHLPSWGDHGVAGLGPPPGESVPCWAVRTPGQRDPPRGQGLPLTLLSAAGRTKELSPERLERFTQFSREQDLMDEEILILPPTGERLEGVGVLGSRG